MKTDRFMKVMLVIIALLLALNCANGIRAPFVGNSTEAAAPPRFLQKGKVCTMREHNLLGGQSESDYKVIEVEDSGWVKVTRWDTEKNQPTPESIFGSTYWLNTANVLSIRER